MRNTRRSTIEWVESRVQRACYARGDVHWFGAFIDTMGNKTSTAFLEGTTVKLGIIGVTVTPAVTTTNPTWSTFGTNLSNEEVGTGTVYLAGGFTLAGVSWTRTGSTVALDATDVTVGQDLSSPFSAAYFAIAYDDASPEKSCIFYLDLGGPVGNSAGAVTITWNAGGIANAVVS